MLGHATQRPASSLTAGRIGGESIANIPAIATTYQAQSNGQANGQTSGQAQAQLAGAAAQSTPTQQQVIGNPYANQPAELTSQAKQSTAGQLVGYQRSASGVPADAANAQVSSQATAKMTPSPSSSDLSEKTVQLPGGKPPALEGYCVVQAKQSRWVAGKPEFAVQHRGQVYWLSSLADQQAFMANPDKVAPLLAGYDPFIFLTEGRLVPGSIQHTLHEQKSDQLLLFSSARTKEAYSPAADQQAINFQRNTSAIQSILSRMQ
ncbi:MAG TPA: hypothetical protein DDW52_10025 [Planctomycetaceae bacterium]|nr:hypothetical protein [Planctomycetaceae bacterium]